MPGRQSRRSMLATMTAAPLTGALSACSGGSSGSGSTSRTGNVSNRTGRNATRLTFWSAPQAVPREVIEASVVDGAGPVRTALQVKTPLVRSSIVMVAMFTLIFALQLFTEPMLLSQSTPMNSFRFSPSRYLYDAAFTRNNYGLAAAASVVLLVLTIALSYGVTRWTDRSNAPEEEAR